MRRRYPLRTRSLRRLLIVIPSYEVLVSESSGMASPVSTRDPVICGYPLPRLFMERLRRESTPRIHSSRKEENPIKTRNRCGLPLIPTKAWTGGLSITASCKRWIGLSAAVGVYAHSDVSGRSVSDMPFEQAGQQPRKLGESKVDMKRVQTVCLRFESSNPLTIGRCTFDVVKSSRVARPVHARRKACTTAVPSRFYQPVEACRACAMSESCSRCTGIRIRAAVPRTPPP